MPPLMASEESFNEMINVYHTGQIQMKHKSIIIIFNITEPTKPSSLIFFPISFLLKKVRKHSLEQGCIIQFFSYLIGNEEQDE